MKTPLAGRYETIQKFDCEDIVEVAVELGTLTLHSFEGMTEPFYTGHSVIDGQKIPNNLRKLWVHPPSNNVYNHLHDSTARNPRFKELAEVIMAFSGQMTSTNYAESVIQVYMPGAVLMRHKDPNVMTMNVALYGSGTTMAWPNDMHSSPESIESTVGEAVLINGDSDHSVRNNSRDDYRVVLSLISD